MQFNNNRNKNYTAYQSMKECIKSGGRNLKNEIFEYTGDITEACPECGKQMCGDCHNAHADGIEYDGECHPEWV